MATSSPVMEEPADTPPVGSTEAEHNKTKFAADLDFGAFFKKKEEPTDTPPKKRVSNSRPKKGKTLNEINENIVRLMTMGGVALAGLGASRERTDFMFDGLVLTSKAEEAAGAITAIAENNPTVRKVLERAFEAGQWGSVAFIGISIAAPILGNHGAIPGWAGAMAIPDDVPRDLYRAHYDAMRAQEPAEYMGTQIPDEPLREHDGVYQSGPLNGSAPPPEHRFGEAAPGTLFGTTPPEN